MKTIPQRPSFPAPILSDIGWGVLYGIGFVLGVLLLLSYAIGGMAGPLMGELSVLLGVLTALAAHQTRIWLAVVAFGGFCAWVSLDPFRDAVATAFLCGVLLGVAGLLGASYLKWRSKQI